jgi:hypothetical protein
VAQLLELRRKDLMIFATRGLESCCGIWGWVLRMRPCKQSFKVAALSKKEPSLLKARSAKHTSKICSPVTVNGDWAGYPKNCSGCYKQSIQKPFFFNYKILQKFDNYRKFLLYGINNKMLSIQQRFLHGETISHNIDPQVHLYINAQFYSSIVNFISITHPTLLG